MLYKPDHVLKLKKVILADCEDALKKCSNNILANYLITGSFSPPSPLFLVTIYRGVTVTQCSARSFLYGCRLFAGFLVVCFDFLSSPVSPGKKCLNARSS